VVEVWECFVDAMTLASSSARFTRRRAVPLHSLVLVHALNINDNVQAPWLLSANITTEMVTPDPEGQVLALAGARTCTIFQM
jgi:hypothetical protein